MEPEKRIEAAEIAPGDKINIGGGGSAQFIEAAAAGSGSKLPGFDYVAYTGGAMRVGSFFYPVVVDLAGLSINRQDLPVRSSHIPTDGGIGHTVSAAVIEGSVKGRAEVSRDTAQAKEFITSSRNKYPWQVSIGASVQNVEFVKEGSKTTVNGKEFAGPLSVVRKGTLEEISICDLGADKNTSTKLAARSHEGGGNMKTFEQWLKDKGLEAASEAEQVGLRKAYEVDIKASASGTEGAPVVDLSRIDAVAAEAARKEKIQVLGAQAAAENPGRVEEIKATVTKAINENWPLVQAELELIRGNRVQAPAVQSVDKGARSTGAHIEAAALMSVGFSGDQLIKSKAASEQVVDEAQREFRGGIGLQEIVLRAAQAHGYRGRDRVTTGNWRELVAYGTPDIKAAGGMSTLSLPGILGNVANKALGAVAADPIWVAPRITGKASHANFHSHTVYSLALNGELQEVGPTGELKHLNVDSESYTRQVGTRGAILRLSRTDIINDDLGAFNRNAQTLARKSYNTREKALFKIINVTGAGSTHFTAARGNYLAAAVAFGPTALGSAIAAFRALTGPDGDPIMVEPSIVLVSPTNEEAGRTTLAVGNGLIVTGLSSTGAKGLQGGSNIYAGRFGGKPEVSPWLEKSSLTGYSTTAWYLLADPSVYPCFEIAYLDGNETPVVDYFGIDAQADTLGMTWRVYWDFGVGAAEWRAGVKSAGA